MNRPQYLTHRQHSDENGALRNPYGRDDRLRESGYQARQDNLRQLEERNADRAAEHRSHEMHAGDSDAWRNSGHRADRYTDRRRYEQAYTGKPDMWSGADQRYFNDLGSREWAWDRDRDGARQDGQTGWRSNPYEDGSYLGNDWRDTRSSNAQQWRPGESGRYSSSEADFDDRPTAQRYGRQFPKGYSRPDERVQDDVCEHLYHADDIDLSDVSVEARNGTVTLEGSVPERRMKRRIEEITAECVGVQDVENRIRIKPDAGGYRASQSSGS